MFANYFGQVIDVINFMFCSMGRAGNSVSSEFRKLKSKKGTNFLFLHLSIGNNSWNCSSPDDKTNVCAYLVP